MSLADILASFLAYGLLHLRGHEGHSGWRWLFLLEVCENFCLYAFRYLIKPGTLDIGRRPGRLCPHASWTDANGQLGSR